MHINDDFMIEDDSEQEMTYRQPNTHRLTNSRHPTARDDCGTESSVLPSDMEESEVKENDFDFTVCINSENMKTTNEQYTAGIPLNYTHSTAAFP